MKFFDSLKNNAAKSRLTEEMIYEQVSEELKDGIRREGLWTKAVAESNGSDDFAKSIYIKLRFQSIVDEVTVVSHTRSELDKSTSTRQIDLKFKKNSENKSSHIKPNDDGFTIFEIFFGIILIFALVVLVSVSYSR